MPVAVCFVFSCAFLLLQQLNDNDVDEVFRIPTRDFALPITLDRAQAGEIQQLRLYVSFDEGKTWKKAASASPKEENFTYSATGDGIFWFTVQVIFKDGRAEPKEIRDPPFIRKVFVEKGEVARLTRKPANGASPNAQSLEQEVAELREKLKALQKRLAELRPMEKAKD
jgi:hypothetical protein